MAKNGSLKNMLLMVRDGLIVVVDHQQLTTNNGLGVSSDGWMPHVDPSGSKWIILVAHFAFPALN